MNTSTRASEAREESWKDNATGIVCEAFIRANARGSISLCNEK